MLYRAMLVILRSLAVIICQRVEVFDLYYSATQDNWWVVSHDNPHEWAWVNTEAANAVPGLSFVNGRIVYVRHGTV